jgi:DNA-binding NarL/FixJ family response regulator
MYSRLDPALALTARRIEILQRLAAGRSPREIAKDLGTSVETVYEHLEVMRNRLGAHSNPELVYLALSHGFLRRAL